MGSSVSVAIGLETGAIVDGRKKDPRTSLKESLSNLITEKYGEIAGLAHGASSPAIKNKHEEHIGRPPVAMLERDMRMRLRG